MEEALAGTAWKQNLKHQCWDSRWTRTQGRHANLFLSIAITHLPKLRDPFTCNWLAILHPNYTREVISMLASGQTAPQAKAGGFVV